MKKKLAWLVLTMKITFALSAPAVLFMYPQESLTGLSGRSLCVFKNLTGRPCPGCGMTRAFVSIAHGDISTAWSYNKASFAAFPLACWLWLVFCYKTFKDARQMTLNRKTTIADQKGSEAK